MLHDLTGAQTRELLASLQPDDRTASLAELPANATQRLLTILSAGDLAEARQLLYCPEESVGRLMTPHFLRVRADETVVEGLAYIRRYGRSAEALDAIYSVDAAGHIIDDLDLRIFVMANPTATVASLMTVKKRYAR